MKTRLFGTAAALAIATSGALAADLPVVEPPVVEPPLVTAPQPAADWSGFYAGVHGGYGFGETEISVPAFPFAAEYDIDGWLAGLQAGYNMQSGMWLFGVEGDIAFSSIDGSYTDPGQFAQTMATDIDWLATIRARAGLHYDRWMPYVTGGLALAGVDHSIMPAGLTMSDTLVGWTIGGGVEAMFNANWTAKLEYLYVDLEDVDFTAGAAAPITGAFDDDFHVIRAGLNYQF